MTAEETFGRRLERLGPDAQGDSDRRVELDEDGQVAHPARRGGDPLRDLGLDHQDEAVRARRAAEEPVQDRARDVVRQVRDDAVRARHELGQLLVERVALDEPQPAVVDRFGEALREVRAPARRRARPP